MSSCLYPLSHLLSPHFGFETGPLTCRSSLKSLGWLTSEPQRLPCLCLPSADITGMYAPESGFLQRVLGIQFIVSCLCRKHSIKWIIFLVMWYYLLFFNYFLDSLTMKLWSAHTHTHTYYWVHLVLFACTCVYSWALRDWSPIRELVPGETVCLCSHWSPAALHLGVRPLKFWPSMLASQLVLSLCRSLSRQPYCWDSMSALLPCSVWKTLAAAALVLSGS